MKLKFFIMDIIKKTELAKVLFYFKNRIDFIAFYYMYFALAKNTKKKVFLVYTMGKVGSSTISYLLDSQLQEYSIYHLHWLNKENLSTDRRFYKKLFRRNRKKISDIKYGITPGYIQRGYFVRKNLKKMMSRKETLKICTLVRDPVERNISSFFENLKIFFGYDVLNQLEISSEEEVVDELISIFLNNYIINNRIEFIDCDPLTWFDEELKTVFGIDVYGMKFNREKGFEIYENKNSTVLVIRLENLNDCFAEATTKLLGRSIQMDVSKNRSRNKDYGTVYKMFKERIKLPIWYLDKYYNSRFANHFYSQDEIGNFRKKWHEK